MLVAVVAEMALIVICAPLLNVATNSGAAPSGRVATALAALLTQFGVTPTQQTVLLALLAMVCLLATTHAMFSVWQIHRITVIQENMRRRIRSQIFKNILNAKYEYLTKQDRGTLLYDLNTPTRSLERTISYFGKMLAGIISAFGILGIMFYLSWQASLFVGSLGLLGVGLWRLYTEKRSNQIGKVIYEVETKVNQIEVDAIDGVKVVKAYGVLDRMIAWHHSALFQQMGPMLRHVLFVHAPRAVNIGIASFLVLLVAVMVFGYGYFDLTLPQLVVFFVAMRQLGPTLAGISGSFTELGREQKNTEVIAKSLYKIPQEEHLEASGWNEPVQRIVFNDVDFNYSGQASQPVLEKFNLELKKGTVSAIVGATGVGKSTVANLLIGLYEPSGGYISVNGKDLKKIDISSWRKGIGYVGQDVFLFNTTIAENITLGNPDVTADDLKRALELAQVNEFIETLPEKLDTRVGDRGFRLSGGQCQRLAVARAILHRPEVLIFDEATSALDNLTENAIYNAIGSLRANAVVLVIAHRLSTVRDADQIVVLEKGRAVECGTHQQLLEKGGRYAAFAVNT